MEDLPEIIKTILIPILPSLTLKIRGVLSIQSYFLGWTARPVAENAQRQGQHPQNVRCIFMLIIGIKSRWLRTPGVSPSGASISTGLKNNLFALILIICVGNLKMLVKLLAIITRLGLYFSIMLNLSLVQRKGSICWGKLWWALWKISIGLRNCISIWSIVRNFPKLLYKLLNLKVFLFSKVQITSKLNDFYNKN